MAPSAMRISTWRDMSGSKVLVRMLSTLRAPLSTSVQRLATRRSQRIVVDQVDLVILLDAPLDLAELEPDDLLERFVAHGK